MTKTQLDKLVLFTYGAWLLRPSRFGFQSERMMTMRIGIKISGMDPVWKPFTEAAVIFFLPHLLFFDKFLVSAPSSTFHIISDTFSHNV